MYRIYILFLQKLRNNNKKGLNKMPNLKSYNF